MRIHRGFEKRDWGSGKLTWREIPAIMRSYKNLPKSIVVYTTRKLSNKRAKKELFK